MKTKRFISYVLTIGLGFIFFNTIDKIQLNDKWIAIYEQEHNNLLTLQKHLSPVSPEGIKTAEKLKKMERRKEGYVKSEKPDEFVRILHEMRIPFGKTEHEYSINYKMKELEKARKNKKYSKDVLPWIERGPGNVAGRARGLIVDPGDPTKNTWFVGSVGGGIWKTTDAGASWADIAPDLPNLAVSTLAMAPSNHDIIYAGTGESMYSVDVINGDGIYKSVDRGLTWSQLPSTISNPNFNNIARIIVDPQNANIVLAATSSGRYKINTENKHCFNIWTELS